MRVINGLFQILAIVTSVFLIGEAIVAQERKPPGTPEDTVEVCIIARCEDSGNEFLISASGADETEATNNALAACSQLNCGGGTAVKVNRPVPFGACDEGEGVQKLAAGQWRIGATVHYCDGTTLSGIFATGDTYWDARLRARRKACSIIDPTRPVRCICYRIDQCPCCPCRCRR
jgi:hypothetical protein